MIVALIDKLRSIKGEVLITCLYSFLICRFQQFYVCEEELSKALQLASDFKQKIDEEEAMKQDILSELLSERSTKANKLQAEQKINKEVSFRGGSKHRKLDQMGCLPIYLTTNSRINH